MTRLEKGGAHRASIASTCFGQTFHTFVGFTIGNFRIVPFFSMFYRLHHSCFSCQKRLILVDRLISRQSFGLAASAVRTGLKQRCASIFLFGTFFPDII